MKTVAIKLLSFRSRQGSLFLSFARTAVQRKFSTMSDGCIAVHDPLGVWQTNHARNPDVVIKVSDLRFYPDVMIAGSNGAASAYRDGYWQCNNLTELFQILLRNVQSIDKIESGLAGLGNKWLQYRHRMRGNTLKGSHRNIKAHYDLGNDFFQLFLDSTMTYSCGIFVNKYTTLEQASVEKLDSICRKLDLKPCHRVLEIGSGWGSFAIHAAKNYGCHVTTITISKQQYTFAKQRIMQSGLNDHIDIKLCDYRQVSGSYDKLVSIEMIEAVGHEFLPIYFAKCAELLKPGGQALIQAITMPDRRYKQYLKSSDFIQQFIFPGSCVPSLTVMMTAISNHSDLKVSYIEDFGIHYAKTLQFWLHNFLSVVDEIKQQGYTEDFIRLWEYYLCYCEAGFKEKYTGLVQMCLDKPSY